MALIQADLSDISLIKVRKLRSLNLPDNLNLTMSHSWILAVLCITCSIETMIAVESAQTFVSELNTFFNNLNVIHLNCRAVM